MAQSPLTTYRLGEPTIRIGEAANTVDEELLSGVIGATVLRDGTIAIGDGAAPRILLFSRQGRFQRSVGAKGDGPGELRVPRWLGRCGSPGFAAYDVAQKRLTLFSPDGTVQRTIPLSSVAGFSPVITCNPAALIFLLTRPVRRPSEIGASWMVNTSLVRVRGLTVDTLSAVTGAQEYYINKAGNSFSEVPLGRRVVASAGPTRLFVCTNQDARCLVFDSAGRQQGTFSVKLPRHTVSVRHWDLARCRLVEHLPSAEERQVHQAVLKEISSPREFPLIDEVQVDSRDRLWVRTFAGYGTKLATWIVLSPEGRPLFRVMMPDALRTLEIGDSYVLGLARDADGVESVSFHPIRLPSR